MAQTKKIVAIMFTSLVNYTKLTKQDSKLALESAFWRAEMAYASLVQKKIHMSPKIISHIVKLYKAYLMKKHKNLSSTFYK